jgi:hypothetical protein
MPVIIEAQSVVLKTTTILSCYSGGWDTFKREIPNDSLCCDGKIVRVGFMEPYDGVDYLELLAERGIGFYQPPSISRQFATIDQLSGPIVAVDWLEMRHIPVDDDPCKTVLACRLVGDTSQILAVPDGWEFEESLSQRCLTFDPGHDSRYHLYRNLVDGGI